MPMTAQNLSDNVGASELDRLLQGGSDALTDGMVERMATTFANMLEIIDKLNEEPTRDAVMSLLDEVTKLHRAGALTSTFELIHLVHGIRSAMTDSMVERLAVFVEHMATNLVNEEVAGLAGEVNEAVLTAKRQTEQQAVSGGLLSTLKLLSQPETQSALLFMVNMARSFQAK